MRKNSPRKWLHAVLDLLPVILIPVFMVYSHRHEINTGSIQVQEKIAVDFNQDVKNLENRSWTTNSGCYVSVTNSITYLNGTLNDLDIATHTQDAQDNIFIEGHLYLFKWYISDAYSGKIRYILGGNGSPFTYTDSASTSGGGIVLRASYTSQTNSNKPHYILRSTNTGGSLVVQDVYCSFYRVDLTQMFGEGNEPTLNEFVNLYPNYYYSYTLSDKQLIDGDLVTYNDTDIMSQFTYQLYNSVDKYFNMGNVFNMNGVYDWFNLNIFHGSAPIYIYVVWQIVLYEFVMDLLFLLYGLFMWFIDMVQHLMDKPFKSIK